ncbi:multidrug effflux MFS transporter [Nonomuraea sp. NN258]|uniref:multidrug effflux MFS transporter n=1 Tax=Nonomuraea antri TaxID=2730852 RepID=UPI001569F4D0|nr:multidrug effflux MFS transporter [Nonomuraea antri]NRQ30949.1 multidrug effflux MFS transporter [Nonomuraea antri]
MTSVSPQAKERPAVVVAILAGLSAIGPLSIDMYLPALPELGRELGAGASLTQLTITACVVGIALGTIAAGPTSDLLGRRRPLLAGVIGYAVASLLCVIAPSATLLIVFRLLQGFTGGCAMVIARAVVRDRHEGVAAARFFATLIQISALAPVLAPLAGGLLLEVMPWRGLFAVISGLGVLLTLMVLWFLPESLAPDKRDAQGPKAVLAKFGRLASDRTFAGYALTAALSFAALFTYISGSSFVIQDVYRLSPLTYSVIFALNSAGIVVMGRISSRVVGRHGPRRILGIGLALSSVGGLVVVTSPVAGLWTLLPGLFLVVASVGFIVPNSVALAISSHPPHMAGTASAFMGATQFLFAGVAAPLAGAGGAHTSTPMVLILAGLSLSALVVYRLTPVPQTADAGES